METPINEILAKAAENQKNGVAFVLATVVEGVEKTPGRSGFKLISYANGDFEGTVGGGELEQQVLQECEKVHKSKTNILMEYKLTVNSDGIGMQCGGTAKVFLEYYPATKKVFIFGAGHLGRSVVPILKSIGFYTIIIDNRADFANPEKVPEADEVIASDYVKFIEEFTPSENDAIVIFTHGHKFDFAILDSLCKKNVTAKYIGMIGSKVKVKTALSKIKNKNYAGNLIEKVFAPIGLNIAKTTTQEISISIAAEILAVYNNVKEIHFMKDSLKKT